MRRLLLVVLFLITAWQTLAWHKYAVRMAMVEGKALGLNQCRSMFVKATP